MNRPINEMRCEFESRSVNEGFARALAAGFLSQLDPTLEELGDVKTAVSEAVTNCIVHAYPKGIGKILLRVRLYPDSTAEITIRDWGVGIPDIDKAMEPLYTTGGEDRSGMGFTIMSSFTDGLRVRSRPGKGTTVVMKKRVSPRTEPK